MTVSQYIESINKRYNSRLSTEHTFRGDLQQLIETIAPKVRATNEPKRQQCGAPDYILTVKEVPVGYIEAKDIGDTDLDGNNKNIHKEQFDRYKASLPNLIFTDYINFHLYRDGTFVMKIAIGEITPKGIKPIKENFADFERLIIDFCLYAGQTIKSSKKLAKMMAGKARLLASVMKNALTSDENSQENSTLRDQMQAFKEILIHNIEPKSFADIYAQTVAYGLFAARLNDPTLETFSRQEAAELIPKTNPFLRRLFQHIAGPEIDDRIKWIVDDLALIFRATDLDAILKNYGKTTQTEDPIIHFYETFLSEYDPSLRESRGVWYTPQPVVNFIVRAVDDILKSEFGLSKGLADTSTVKLQRSIEQSTDKRYADNKKKELKSYHKVQILDPATGTGTFLAETVKHIHKYFEEQQGLWNDYVENHLLTRLNGFELLMASYAMAHLKMDLILRETGFCSQTNQRLRIYLTNSLEEHHPDTGTLWANWLSNEANEANLVKRDTPVMVVMGNPPYRGESSNKGKWIMGLMDDYKKEPGGKLKLKERNPKWINDDYVKFIRFAQHFIEKNKSGVLAFINPHGYLDNPTFRGMRWNLLKTYDKIYTIDLHGNANKKEVSPDGSVDENVFDIMQGVSINLFIKTGKKVEDDLGKVFHYELYGKRENKYNFLTKHSINSINFNELSNIPPNYYFVKKDFTSIEEYENGIAIEKLFNIGNSGVVTKRDKLNIHDTKADVVQMLDDVLNLNEQECRRKYSIPDDVRDWNFSLARQDIRETKQNPELIQSINYRPFDKRFFYYTRKSKGVVGWPVPIVSDHLLKADNLGLMVNKKVEIGDFSHCIIYKDIVESHALSMKEINYVFPLYIYNKTKDELKSNDQFGRIPNFNSNIISEIEKSLSLTFVNEKVDFPNNLDAKDYKTFAPIDLLDYLYAVLHSPSYREKYKEFLKIDFPRVSYPENKENFWELVKLGGELRQIHLLESPKVEQYITRYPIAGDNVVGKQAFKEGKVYINETQYFDNVPEIAWNFYIGGYQPAQKWLKDRKGRTLSYEDILHYQKIIVALTETDRIMKKIDEVITVYQYNFKHKKFI